MKIKDVYVRKEWLYENTTRQKYRDLTPSDYVASTKKVLKGVPLLVLVGAGLSKGHVLATQSIGLLNYSQHSFKEIHNGITNAGRNVDCRFYEPIDMSTQSELKNLATTHLALPYTKLWLVTDDSEAQEEEISKGVLFHSKSEAEKFEETYKGLDDYIHSSFYKKPSQIPFDISSNDLDTFRSEMQNYLDLKKPSISGISERIVEEEHFLISFIYGEEPDNFLTCPDGGHLVEIAFPDAVSEKDYKEYFPETEQARLRLIAETLANDWSKITEKEKEEEMGNELSNTDFYEQLAREYENFDLESDNEFETSSEYEGSETTLKGKEKERLKHSDDSDAEEEILVEPDEYAGEGIDHSQDNPGNNTEQLLEDLKPIASGKVTTISAVALAGSMSKGVFRNKVAKSEEDGLTDAKLAKLK